MTSQPLRRKLIAAIGIGCLASSAVILADGGLYKGSPHGSQTTGVYRLSTLPRGSCEQCHTSHETNSQPFGLFRENSNELCFSASLGGCHADRPTGASAGYPAQEADRMPNGSSDAGYFEYNSGGLRLPGLSNLVRWPGKTIWQDPLYSTHYSSPIMPVRDAFGNGACDNCHNVHGGPSKHDMLDTSYSGVAGSQFGSLPESYALCLKCHNVNGPTGMSDPSRNIAYYFDRSVNPGAQTGHGISSGSGYVPSGARLACFDCHNPHGSAGYGNAAPNDFLLSDQRPGWYGLTNIRTDTAQVRRFCFGCHKSSDGLGGSAIEGMTLLPLPTTVSAHQFAANRHCYDCHGRDYSTPTGRNVHNPDPGGDCVSCHSTIRNGRRAIVAEFNLKGHHGIKVGASGTITNKDCGVCHMEGSPSTGSPDPAFHRNGLIDLRGPDNGQPLAGFATLSRNLSSAFLEPTVLDVQNQFCLKCHDVDGAASLQTRVPTGTATAPFSDTGARVIDVATQFATSGNAFHPVLAAGANPYCVPGTQNGNVRTMLPPFNQTSIHNPISCFDCHETSGHGAPNSGMLYTETYFRDVTQNASFGTAQQTFCTRCHDWNYYGGGSNGSRFSRHRETDHTLAGGQSMSCRGCHAGIYDNDLMPTCGNGAGVGTIHGTSFPFAACSPTPGVRPKALLQGGHLKGWRSTSATSATCYANCHHSSGQNY